MSLRVSSIMLTLTFSENYSAPLCNFDVTFVDKSGPYCTGQTERSVLVEKAVAIILVTYEVCPIPSVEMDVIKHGLYCCKK